MTNPLVWGWSVVSALKGVAAWHQSQNRHAWCKHRAKEILTKQLGAVPMLSSNVSGGSCMKSLRLCLA
jgi:hypothetical protein